MQLLYNLGIRLYVFAIYLASPINTKAKLWVSGRKDIFKRISEQVSTSANIVWFHISSLGEFEQARPVIEELKKQQPQFKVLITFFSPSGYEVRKNYEYADWVFYLPYDSHKNAKRFINLVNPKLAFFVKYDFWYHYLHQLNKNNIPVYLFSAIFRSNQYFFKSYGTWYQKMLRYFTFIFVQNKQSADLLQSINIENIAIGGDTRFDRVCAIVKNAKPIPEIETFCNGKQTIVAGSSWDKDEILLLEYLKKHNELKLVIAPHEVHKSNINRIEKLCEGKAVKLSECNNVKLSDYQILIIDSIGILSSAYRYGTIAYIGGGFGKGIHNTLEAAAYGIPVVFGSNYKKFEEAKDLLKVGAGFTINNQSELDEVLDRLLTDKQYLDNSKKQASDYVNSMQGGTKLLMDSIDFNQIIRNIT